MLRQSNRNGNVGVSKSATGHELVHDLSCKARGGGPSAGGVVRVVGTAETRKERGGFTDGGEERRNHTDDEGGWHEE